jgi:hypothetical protein
MSSYRNDTLTQINSNKNNQKQIEMVIYLIKIKIKIISIFYFYFKCYSLNSITSDIKNKLIAKLSANLSIGQSVSITTSSAIIELTKINSLDIKNQIRLGKSELNVPSFCLMTNQFNNCQNKITIIEV